MLILVLASGVLLTQNLDTLRAYVNRPVTSVRMATPLLRVQEQDVRKILAQFTDAGFFAMDVSGLKQALEADPWVEQAIIRRIWPDTLTVAIQEEVPIARWGEAQLLNQYGVIFKPEDISREQGLPLLAGPDGSAGEMMQQYQLFSRMLQSKGLRIQVLELSIRGSWNLVFSNEVTMQIGREQVLDRMQRFITFYDYRLHTQFDQISAIDLRYRNGMAIKMKSTVPIGVAAT
ncbi:MAG: cell division protein FtsQ/DivIB [Pseudomonadales bacterium]|nr:cell division protein FtsQ/DivIB [Pseudomonadales bacterium]